MKRCDRCGGKPRMRYEQADLTLILCDTHAKQHGRALLDGGWFAYRIAEKVSA